MCFEGFYKDVGNGGISRCSQIKNKHDGFALDTTTAATASASVSAARSGNAVPAESARVGKGRRIEAVKSGGRDGLIGGDGRDSLRNGSFDVDSLRNGSFDVDGIEGKGKVKGLVKHIEKSVNTYRRSSLSGMHSPELHQPGHTERSTQLPSCKVATGPPAPVVLPPHDDG